MKAAVFIDPEKRIAPIDKRLYSSFIEHMGRAVYTGIYEPEHPTADAEGFRGDVAEHIRALDLSCIRYPGGNFLSGYRWEDGVGDREKRPVRRELAWFALEPNYVGINEFVAYCKRLGIEPMLGVNLGTRGAQDAANLVEYCNVPSGSYYSDLRRSHGYEQPHNIKLWCLGNEMDGAWQICAKTAEEYGRLACETAKLMKWTDPSIELVACGSSFRAMPTFGSWEETVLRHCWEHIDYLSLHQYYQNLDGDIPAFLARSDEMGGFIDEVAEICAREKRRRGGEHEVKLSFDEWNVWYHFQKDCAPPEKWICPRPIEEERYDFADALLVGCMLNTLINHADSVKIACLAQLVNVIAPIMTVPGGGSWLQTIYYPFLFASRFGRGTALSCETDCPAYSCAVADRVKYLSSAAVLSEDGGELAMFFVNRSLSEELELSVSLPCKGLGLLEGKMLCAPPEAVNSIDIHPVLPQNLIAKIDKKGVISAVLRPHSWNMLRIKL